MARRKYTKRSDYWKKFEKNFQYPNNPYESLASESKWEPQLIGDSFYDHTAEGATYSRGGGASSTDFRRNQISVNPKLYGYSNIRAGMLPYHYSFEGVDG